MSRTLEERLDEVESKLALYDLMHDYQRLADERRYREWADCCFTEDAVFENSFGSLQGREQIYEGCAEAMKIFEVQTHVIANTRFRVNGDEATGTGVVLFTGVPDAKKPGEQVVSGGHYDWRFRRTPDGWKLCHSFLNFVWSRGDKTGMFTTPT